MNSISLSAVAWVALFAQLQPPAPSPAKTGQIPKDKAAFSDAKSTAANDQAQPIPTTVKKEESKPNDRPHDDKTDPQNGQSSNSGASTILITAFTFGLLIVAALQWWTLRQQVEHMRLDQRAWLGIRIKNTEIVPNQKPEIRIVVKNTGRTPGTIEKTVLSINPTTAPVDFEQVKNFHLHVAKASIRETVIAPGGKKSLRCDAMPAQTEAQVLAINQNAVVVVIMVTITYLDVTNRRHETRCCSIYDVPTKEFFVHDWDNYMH